MVVFITGISSGFGLETAKLLSQEGHTVYGTVRREVESLPKVHYFQVDVRDSKAVKKAVNEIVEKEGRIDVLVNNAGMGVGVCHRGGNPLADGHQLYGSSALCGCCAAPHAPSRQRQNHRFEQHRWADGATLPRLLFRQQVRHRRLLRSTPAGDEAVWR